MGGGKGFGGKSFGDKGFGGKSRGLILTLACLALLAGGCNESKTDGESKADSGVFDTSRLPRVSGAKEVFASPATTIFTSPDSVAQTADTVDKALAAGGWQKYIAPNTAYANDPNMRIASLKKGTQALSVFITIAPAQNNATSVQYAALVLKTDLPFIGDASNIEYSPERALLTLVTGEPIDKTLDFYRKELGARGWSLWSQKLNGNQPAGEPSGELTKSGAYAYYVQGDRRLAALVLERAEAGRIKLKFEVLPAGYLETLQKEFFNSDNTGAEQVDVSRLPRLDGAKEDAARTSSDHLSYSVASPLASTVAAIKKTLGADGWKPYVVPLDDVYLSSLALKKGRQGLSLSFYIQVGKNEQTSEVTTVDYSPTRLIFALALPDDATDIVFDANRPYLNANTAGTVDATLAFYRKELGAMGWSPLSAADAAAHWPNAKLDETIANGAIAYFHSRNATADRAVAATRRRRQDQCRNQGAAVCTASNHRGRQGHLRIADTEAIQDLGRYRRLNTARGLRPCAGRDRHCAGVLSPRARRAPLERRDAGRRRHSAGDHAQLHRAGRTGRAQAGLQV